VKDFVPDGLLVSVAVRLNDRDAEPDEEPEKVAVEVTDGVGGGVIVSVTDRLLVRDAAVTEALDIEADAVPPVGVTDTLPVRESVQDGDNDRDGDDVRRDLDGTVADIVALTVTELEVVPVLVSLSEGVPDELFVWVRVLDAESVEVSDTDSEKVKVGVQLLVFEKDRDSEPVEVPVALPVSVSDREAVFELVIDSVPE
jgi:hypothetical protein